MRENPGINLKRVMACMVMVAGFLVAGCGGGGDAGKTGAANAAAETESAMLALAQNTRKLTFERNEQDNTTLALKQIGGRLVPDACVVKDDGAGPSSARTELYWNAANSTKVIRVDDAWFTHRSRSPQFHIWLSTRRGASGFQVLPIKQNRRFRKCESEDGESCGASGDSVEFRLEPVDDIPPGCADNVFEDLVPEPPALEPEVVTWCRGCANRRCFYYICG